MGKNPEGHSPRWWKKHSKAHHPQEKQSVQESATPDSISGPDKPKPWWQRYAGKLVLTVTTVVFTIFQSHGRLDFIPDWLLGVLWVVCALYWLLAEGHIRRAYSKHRPISQVVAGVAVILIAATIRYRGPLWNMIHPQKGVSANTSPKDDLTGKPPDLKWNSLSMHSSRATENEVKYMGKEPTDLLFMFEGKIDNWGGPSTTYDWEASIKLPTETKERLGYLIVSSDDRTNYVLLSRDRKVDGVLPAAAADLPETTATKPISAGGTVYGYAYFKFDGLARVRTLKGATITLSFQDNRGHRTVFSEMLPQPDGPSDPKGHTELFPGMPPPVK